MVKQLADYLAQAQPGLHGFTKSNLFRMRQFYETYRNDQKVAPVVRQLSWSHHLLILGQCKRPEEREFYLRMAIQEKWGELERQIEGALFEQVVLSPPKVSAVLTQIHPEALNVFKNSYLLEFLERSQGHTGQNHSHPTFKLQ